MAEDTVFRVMLRMEIKDGMGADFESTWLRIGDSVTSHPANLGQWLCRSDEPGIYFITSDWVDEPGFREFEHSGRHVEHRELLHPYRCGGAMDTMHVVAHLAGTEGGTTHAEWEAAR
jgi:heme-degrading monooxygenase HmoA